jgi:twitching motility two-component system response regulator PilG
MSTLLHQAVQLAQTGQRVEARQMLWQFLQTEPDNEVAWLWLASVAADQTEYERALNEVLRINPGNPRAQQLLAEFRQQVGGMPPAAQYAPPQRPVTPPPPISPYAPPPPPVLVALMPTAAPTRRSSVVEERRGCLG